MTNKTEEEQKPNHCLNPNCFIMGCNGEHEQGRTTIRQCDQCNNEDSINCITGLCPSCDLSNILNPNNKYRRTQKEILKGVFKE